MPADRRSPTLPQGGAQPLFTISIVSHGHSRELTALLRSLTEHEPTDQIQLLVTDNLHDDLPDIANGGWHQIIMLRPPRPRGFAANHNAAFKSAAGQYFCVLNPDVVFQQPVLLALARHLEAGAGHIAAPILRDSRGRVQDSFRELPTPSRLAQRLLIPSVRGGAATLNDALLYPDWIAGTFMLMQRDTFTALGGFDARYRLYFEDVDLCTRARLQGMRMLVDPALEVRHDPRHASHRGGRHLLWHVGSAMRFLSSDVYRRARRRIT